jgi:hypothetical protein
VNISGVDLDSTIPPLGIAWSVPVCFHGLLLRHQRLLRVL